MMKKDGCRTWICEQIRQNPSIDDKIIHFICFEGKKYIYGNTLQTAVCLQIFKDLMVEIAGVIMPPGQEVSNRRGYWKRLMNEYSKFNIYNVDRDAYVLVAVPFEDVSESKRLLELYGFKRLMNCCWMHNSDWTHICYELYYEHNFEEVSTCIETG